MVPNSPIDSQWFCFVYLYFKNQCSMTTFTIKINERTKAGKAFRMLTETFFKDAKGIEITEKSDEKEDEVYNPEFVKKILERTASSKNPEEIKKWKKINPDDVWGSIV